MEIAAAAFIAEVTATAVLAEIKVATKIEVTIIEVKNVVRNIVLLTAEVKKFKVQAQSILLKAALKKLKM